MEKLQPDYSGSTKVFEAASLLRSSARHEILTVRDELARGAVCWSDEA